MATRHNLALEIPHIGCENAIRIMDTSVYGHNMVISCPRLDVTLPGFNSPVYITQIDGEDLQPYFTVNLSAVELDLQPESNTGLLQLPDGLYTIRYSVSPNDKVYVEKYHLRTTSIDNQYYTELCKLQLEPCEPGAELKQKINDLRYIRMYIDAAIAKAEYCNSPNQATDMLNFASRLLNKFYNGECITCRS